MVEEFEKQVASYFLTCQSIMQTGTKFGIPPYVVTKILYKNSVLKQGSVVSRRLNRPSILSPGPPTNVTIDEIVKSLEDLKLNTIYGSENMYSDDFARYLRNKFPNLHVYRKFQLPNNLRADIVVYNDNLRVCIECKRYRAEIQNRHGLFTLIGQLSFYTRYFNNNVIGLVVCHQPISNKDNFYDDFKDILAYNKIRFIEKTIQPNFMVK